MIQLIKIIGRVDGCVVFVRRIKMRNKQKVLADFQNKRCIVLDLLSGKRSHLVTLEQINDVCPFKIVTSENEEEVLMDLVEEIIPEGIVEKIESILSENSG